MKIIVEITDAGDEMVKFKFEKIGHTDYLPVLRATARIMRAIGEEHARIHGESDYIKEILGKSEK